MKQSRFNVDSTACRFVNAESTLFQRKSTLFKRYVQILTYNMRKKDFWAYAKNKDPDQPVKPYRSVQDCMDAQADLG